MSQDSALAAPNQWHELSSKFETLAKEEQTQAGPRLRATAATTSTPLGDVGEWRLDGANSDKICERFALIGTQAGLALGTPPGGADILNYWLHRLCQNVCYLATPSVPMLMETRSYIRIENVCEESSTFCIGLQRLALAGQADRGTLADSFSKWIDDNSSGVEPFYWSTPSSGRNWISHVAKGAKASIPIHFLSARLNVHRLPLLPSEHDSLRKFFDQIAKEHELIWCITKSGLWMAQQPPNGAYIDASGSQKGDVIDHCTSESAFSGSSRKGDTVARYQEPSTWTRKLVQRNIDPILLADKRRKISCEMQSKSVAARKSANNPAKWAEAELKITDEWAEKFLNAWREIWDIQGFPECHEFYRAFYDWEIVHLVAARKSSFQGACQHLEMLQRKPHSYSAAQGFFARELDRLAGDWINRLDVESRKAMYAARREQAALTEAQRNSSSSATNGASKEGQELQPDLILENTMQPEVTTPKLSNRPGEATRESLLIRIQNAPDGYDFKSKIAAKALGVSVRTIHRRLQSQKLTNGAKNGTVAASSLRRALGMKRPAAPHRQTRT